MRRRAFAATIVLPILGQRPEAVFRTDVKLVQVLATVYDRQGRYLDGLTQESFEVLDNAKAQPITAFETASAQSSPLSCALLIDVTGSMKEDLPTVKNAAIRFIEGLRPVDSAAVYAFNSRLEDLQGFTTDKAAVRQALLRTRPAGKTAVFDALAETTQRVSTRDGRKAIVLFTDGNDNSSLLTPQSASQRAKKSGVPVYTIAEGDAKRVKEFANHLETISGLTGGLSFEAENAKKVDEFFRKIQEDIKHVYLLAYAAPPSNADQWRTIQIRVRGVKDGRVRAREGYYSF